MDRLYIIELIKRIQVQKEEHDAKFAGNPKHANCLPRFQAALEKLEQELARAAGEPSKHQ